MPRLMSVALTTKSVRLRHKTLTRRARWQMLLRPSDQLVLRPKFRGRRRGQPLELIVTVDIVSIHRRRRHPNLHGGLPFPPSAA